jgi:hypothetical protein
VEPSGLFECLSHRTRCAAAILTLVAALIFRLSGLPTLRALVYPTSSGVPMAVAGKVRFSRAWHQYERGG